MKMEKLPQLNELMIEIHERNVAKGFYDGHKNIGEMLCLIHSEVSEALEADRKNKRITFNISAFVQDGIPYNVFIKEFTDNVKNTFEDEMADIIIRTLDLCAHLDIDIEGHIIAKMRYNYSREHKHGKKY